ncbi:MAG: ATP-binding cassette domain-containing protein, partial [Chloroflexales bacterium]|nr:ATP-binding cassette domain-containing protein [Chloroflexales bacterium]
MQERETRMGRQGQSNTSVTQTASDTTQTQPRLQLADIRDVNWRRLFGYVRPYRGRLLIAVVALVISSSLGLALPLAAGQVINAIAEGGALILLNQMALLLVGVVAIQSLFSLVQSYLLSFVGERAVSDLRLRTYEHLQSLSLNFFNNRRVGEITSRVTNDVTLIQTTTTTNVATFLQALIQFAGALVLMFIVSWQLAILALLVVPLVSIVSIIFGRWIRRISTDVQDRLADSASVLEETVAGVRIVQSFAREPYEIGRFRETIEATFSAAMRRTRARAFFQPLVGIVVWGAMVAVLWFGGRLVLTGQLRAGDLIAFLLYAGSIAGTMATFTNLFSQLQEALGATQRVFELLDITPDIADARDAYALPTTQGRISFEHVNFAYQVEDLPVLRDVNLTVEPGEVLALVGPSGAGKSTLVNLIPRFYDVQDGSITIDGHDVRSVQVRSLREQIGIVPQETLLFSGAIRDNICYGKLDADNAALEAAAHAANAHEFIMALPQGYDTLVGERGVKLSGGQRQRIAIARALLKNPRILILDEATSSLDSESEYLVQDALERLMLGRTSIVIAHRLSTVRRAD